MQRQQNILEQRCIWEIRTSSTSLDRTNQVVLPIIVLALTR